jgi:hypothetical protein
MEFIRHETAQNAVIFEQAKKAELPALNFLMNGHNAYVEKKLLKGKGLSDFDLDLHAILFNLQLTYLESPDMLNTLPSYTPKQFLLIMELSRELQFSETMNEPTDKSNLSRINSKDCVSIAGKLARELVNPSPIPQLRDYLLPDFQQKIVTDRGCSAEAIASVIVNAGSYIEGQNILPFGLRSGESFSQLVLNDSMKGVTGKLPALPLAS